MFHCPRCNARLEADASESGDRATCPECSNTVVVPEAVAEPGNILGNFQIDRKIGHGAMGNVFLATQLSMDRQVALKVLPVELTRDQDIVERFINEVRMSARLEHPNIVTAFEAGEDAGHYYLAMSYVDGRNLRDRLVEEKIIPEKEALQICLKVAQALRYAWDQFRILHRDIKPANIMLDRNGNVKLMDMGISKSLAEDCSLTVTGHFVGTPHYISPEQARAETELDFRADIHSLGATLYHLVTGTRPYSGTEVVEVLTKLALDPVPPPRERNSDITEPCALLLETMMAKSATDRHASWNALITDIELVLDGEHPETWPPGRERPSRLLSRKKGRGTLSKTPVEVGTSGKSEAAPEPRHSSMQSSSGKLAIRPKDSQIGKGTGSRFYTGKPTDYPEPTDPLAQAMAAMVTGGLPQRKEHRTAAKTAAPPSKNQRSNVFRALVQGIRRGVRLLVLVVLPLCILGAGIFFAPEGLHSTKNFLAAVRDGRDDRALVASPRAMDGTRLDPPGPMESGKEGVAAGTAASPFVPDTSLPETEEEEQIDLNVMRRRRLGKFFDTIAAELLDNGVESARERLVHARSAPSLALLHDDIRAAADLLFEMNRTSRIIHDSFRKDAGRPIVVGFKEPAIIADHIVVRSVSARSIEAIRTVKDGRLTVGLGSRLTFTVDDLNAAEQLRRLDGSPRSQEIVLRRALLHFELGNLQQARDLVMEVPGYLQEAIARQIDGHLHKDR